MDTELAYKTSFCTEYERLLCNCVTALDCWKERREEVVNRQLSGKQVGDELMRLQADYAKSYSRLEKHKDACELCRFVARMGGHYAASVSTEVMERKHSA
jgi:hypothetical protein